MLDAKTLREELAAMQSKLDNHEKVNVGYAVRCNYRLRELERREDDGRARNPVTGY
jgi:hypothetical protein